MGRRQTIRKMQVLRIVGIKRRQKGIFVLNFIEFICYCPIFPNGNKPLIFSAEKNFYSVFLRRIVILFISRFFFVRVVR